MLESNFLGEAASTILYLPLNYFGYFTLVHVLRWRHVTGSSDFFGLNYYTSRTAKAPKLTPDLKTDPDINVVFGNVWNATKSAAPYDDVRFLIMFITYCIMSFEYYPQDLRGPYPTPEKSVQNPKNLCKNHFNIIPQIMHRSPPLVSLIIRLALNVAFVLVSEFFVSSKHHVLTDYENLQT
jgi:hypothetical protein